MFRVAKEFKFEAAHKLVRSETEACQKVHGHSYRVRIVLTCERLLNGMVVDFGVVSDWMRSIIERLDHSLILREPIREYEQDKVVVLGENPTAENLACQIGWWIQQKVREYEPRLRLESVRVYETDTCWAEHLPEYRDEDISNQ